MGRSAFYGADVSFTGGRNVFCEGLKGLLFRGRSVFSLGAEVSRRGAEVSQRGAEVSKPVLTDTRAAKT